MRSSLKHSDALRASSRRPSRTTSRCSPPPLPEQRAGEASPSYLRSPTAAARIAALNPAARIVAIFREPAAFLRSLHLQYVQSLIEPERDLRRALALEGERREGRELPGGSHWRETLLYSEHVRYVEQLRRYREVFPQSQLLVLVYDDFRADNEATLRRVQRFLEIDDTVPVQTVEANPTVAVRSGPLHVTLRRFKLNQGPAASALRSAGNAIFPRARRRAIFRPVRRRFNRRVLYGRPEPADEQLSAELRARFAGEVAALGEYLGRDLLAEWGYERAG